ncbi:MAG TPA: pyridoxal-phosphate dependent enzyme, partial [Chitinophagaceae bacterium]|nr:pyridoxal-phosphate dependent enzyme [Chitinophagaceae bacterium]
ISGNKWFKLNYYLQQAQRDKATGLLSFGGAYSNHIIAVACAAAALGLPCAGIIRGEQPARLSHTLQEAMQYGMQLEFTSRDSYQTKTAADFTARLSEKYPGYYHIPEGGSGRPGVEGSMEILNLVNKHLFSHIGCAVGTATMWLGLAASALPEQEVIGIPVLKGNDDWQALATSFIPPGRMPFSHIIPGYHFGGYARKNAALLAFMNQFYAHTSIPTDFVYTGKLLFAILDLVEKGYFAKGSRLLAIHSGGLQGNRSLPAGTLDF